MTKWCSQSTPSGEEASATQYPASPSHVSSFDDEKPVCKPQRHANQWASSSVPMTHLVSESAA